MGPFVWNAFRLNRLRSAVRSFNRAITMQARELVASGREHLVRFLPRKVSVAEVQDRIGNANDFRRIVGYRSDLKRGRSSELTRVLKRYNPDALEFTEGSRGLPVTEYEDREQRINRAAIRRERNRQRRAMETDLFEGDELTVDFDGMSPAELGTAMNNTDMMPEDAGESDASVEDLDAETYQRWELEDARAMREAIQPHERLESYLDAWRDPMNGHELMGGFHEFIEALEWMRDHAVEGLNKMFNSGRDEVEVAYLIDSGGNWNPYVNIPIETRHNRAYAFVTGYARKLGWRSTEEGDVDDR